MTKRSTFHKNQDKETLLGQHQFNLTAFPNLDSLIQSFQAPEFLSLSLRKRFKKINQCLYQSITEVSSPAFLFSQVLNFFERINREGILDEPYGFSSFEFWLNHFSDLNAAENYQIRAKIVGKFVPREDYQVFFPIGMNQSYSGTHFIAAHLSPDIDSMIASFIGWMDAFGSRIGNGLHLWCLPGGPPDSPFASIFREIWGPAIFSCLPRTAQTLTLTAMDLVNQKGLVKEKGEKLISQIDHGNEKIIILIDDQGHYLGDWRSADVELVRQIIILFKSCLHWFENNLQVRIISLFAKPNLSIQDVPNFYSAVFDVKIKECQPFFEFTPKQKEHLDHLFSKVLGVERGIEGTFRDLNFALNRFSIFEMTDFQNKVESLLSNDIFDENGILKEDRPHIFNRLQELMGDLDESILHVRNYIERLSVVIAIKYDVLNLPRTYLSLGSDVDEMRRKMQDCDFLPVLIQEHDGALFPVGIVRSKDLREHGMGTVSLRDFSNLEEVRMSSYLEVISIIDHHKSTFRTPSVSTTIIGDVQSCNVLIAEQTFILNDKYSLRGMSPQEIEQQIQELKSPQTLSEMRILQRLLKKRMICQLSMPFYIHPKREFYEYLCFLHAILDDTDLLTKVTPRDLFCVVELLNRLKTLDLKKEVEIIHFDGIPQDENFIKLASQRLLQQPDLHSIYKKIYEFKESEVESNLNFCLNGHYSNIFLDSKAQNGCAQVGQTKLFASNFPYFLEHALEIRKVWLNKSQAVYRDQHEIDLHIHMISTIASANEVYQNQIGPYSHQDELWFWVPSTQQGFNHLHTFLSGFQLEIKSQKNSISLEFLGPNYTEYLRIFNYYFSDIPQIIINDAIEEDSMVILRFKAGTLNSRKSKISPYLPSSILKN